MGLFTRPAAAFIAATMSVAAFVRQAGDPYAERELALLFLAVALHFALRGAGRISVDAALRQRPRRDGSATAA